MNITATLMTDHISDIEYINTTDLIATAAPATLSCRSSCDDCAYKKHNPSNLWDYKVKLISTKGKHVSELPKYCVHSDHKNKSIVISGDAIIAVLNRESETAYTPTKIIRNGPATIVFWSDGEKTIVRKSEGREDSIYDAFCAALAKRIFGTNSHLNSMIRKKTIIEKKKEKKAKPENEEEG